MVIVKQVSPQDSDVQMLIGLLDEYQSTLYPAESNHLDGIETLAKDNVFFVGAYLADTLVGCGAVKIMDNTYGELKRMFVQPTVRGQGIGRKILVALEAHLIQQGIRLARLETGIHQPAAIALYAQCGYTRCQPFGAYQTDPLSCFMEKRL